ncbi:FAR1-related sequence 1 [Rhynchospora pubera]|uniref:FAR1-related sequence 1 n=1 Tax=Rhynchospora pubera TaxID=906938 RepID=A0AAV8FA01_9POAL|nr:FAR1-related sequence 1 [Rhynchospora pubera]
MTFTSETEAFEFFNAYAKRKGFRVRKSIIKRDKTNGAIKFRRFYCSRHGFREKKHIDKPNRKRQHKLLTRCGCPVKFCVKLDKRTGTWWVQDFNDCHNYDLAAVDTAPFLRSHCFISEAQKLEISSKRASGIQNCQILDYDARCRGGYQNRGYQEKNLYNFSTVHERSRFLEDDADSIISIVSCENDETYRWLLEAFLEAMYQVRPESVITDGDLAMGKAIKSILKGTTHRICSWHMERNAKKYIHGKSAIEKFHKLVYTCTSDKFETKWKDFKKEVSKRSPSRQWLQMIYRLKESWAAAFVKKKMFLGMPSTQRSESLNARLHNYIKCKMSLCRAIQQFERCLTRMRTKEAELDCIAFQKEPVLQTPFLDLEKSAVSNYTTKVFYIVQKELKNIQHLSIPIKN